MKKFIIAILLSVIIGCGIGWGVGTAYLAIQTQRHDEMVISKMEDLFESYGMQFTVKEK